MKPMPLRLYRAGDVPECLELLGGADEPGETKVIAGGQSLVPLLALRLAAPAVLVDINALRGLDRIIVRDDEILVGSLVRHARLVGDPDVRAYLPLLSTAAGHIGHLAIRNRGTIGGSLAHADPAAELPAIVALLGGGVVCESARRGRREVPAVEFRVGPLMTQLADDELVTWVRIPRPPTTARHGFAEIAARVGDYARAGAAVQVDPGGPLVRAATFGYHTTPVVVELRLDDAGRSAAALARDLVDAAEETAELTPVQQELTCAAIEKALIDARGRADG